MKRTAVVLLVLLILVLTAGPALAYDRNINVRHRRIDQNGVTVLQFIVVLSLLTAQSPPADCSENVPIRIHLKDDGKWKLVNRGYTNDDSKFKATAPNEAGRYRVTAPAFTTHAGNQCFKSRVYVGVRSTY